MKAFQRNRSRLKKDYDDFRRQPDHGQFTRELWTTEECEGNHERELSKAEISKSADAAEPLDNLEKEHVDLDDMKLSEIGFPVARSKLLKKELPSKDVVKSLPKPLKRQSKQSSYLDDSTKELSPRKKVKLSTNETSIENLEVDMQIDCLNESKPTELPFSESFASKDSVPVSTLQKGTKPIQALLAKNIGNKVTLTNQLPPSTGRSVPAVEKPALSPVETSPIKPALTCLTSTKGPLQMVYKMPCGQWLPVDLPNSSVKIHMQPVVDSKTGEKIMQQVLILPKNFVIQHKEGKAVAKETTPPQQKGTEHCSSSPQTTGVNCSSISVPVTSVSAQLPNTVFSKTVTPSSNVNARSQPLSPVTSVCNVLTSPGKTSQSDAGKVKNAVPSATFPQPTTSPTISSTVQPLLPATTLNESADPGSSLACFSQQTLDSSEAKQELKTVCIRDSQSILVRTRGGNTGVVKVQTNPEQNSPNSLSSSSVFTFAPQLQAFLVPKSTSSPAFSQVAGMTTTSSLPSFSQAPTSVSISCGFHPPLGKNLKPTLGQPSGSGYAGPIIEKTSYVPSSPLKPSVPSSSLLPSTTNSSVSVISISAGNFGQTNANVIPTSAKPQVDYSTKSYPVTRADTTTAVNGDVLSETPVQKLMLVSTPSILPSGSGPSVNMAPAPTSTGISTQKVVFINAPVPSGTSSSAIAAESLKQTLPSPLNKTYVKTPEQPQIVLIPSTVGAPIKINSSPTVSQIKDVKIGLNIGQAIINPSGNLPAMSSINILQSVMPKGEDKSSKGCVSPLSTSGNSVPASSNIVSQNLPPVNESVVSTARATNMLSGTGVNGPLSSLSVTSSPALVGTRPPVLVSGNDTSSRIMPVLSNRLCPSNLGNTVAISTVKTGHLASSVLISTTQPTVSPKCLTSALQIPVALPTPVTTSPKIINTVPHSATVPGATRPVSLSKRQSRTSLQFQSPGNSTTVPTNANTNKPQAELSSLSPSPGKIINISNVTSMPNQHLSPSLVKTTPNNNSSAVGSAIHTCTPPSNITSLAGASFSEPCIQQKIVINTSTPLAPGTQIMMNGARFIVPPQGLGAGSHVLLIATNPKYGPPPLVINSGQGILPTPVDNSVQKIIQTSNNSLSGQPLKHSVRNSTKIVNSLGSPSSLSTVHTTPDIANTPAKLYVPPAPPAALTSVIKSSPATLLAKTSLVSAISSSNPPLPSSTSVFHLDTSVKKLLVSPEGAILNTINTPASKVTSLSSSLPQVVVSASQNPSSVFPAFPSSCLEKPDTAAS
nr:uncharacterized protein KIAA2026 homolog [Meriones unguiculatus]XP_021489925.1 uncharacterized protein KIAA2026 homolog [Meriones unguiculatus]XP_021489926.1 uncharacterized protein KIAA2026 homolog [Meriones unguiculatus]